MVGSDEKHFNVSLTVRDKVTRQCPQTITFEEKGEPKRIRTEVTAYQPNALPLSQTGSRRQQRERRQTEVHAGRCGSLDGRVSLEEGGREGGPSLLQAMESSRRRMGRWISYLIGSI